MPDRVTKDDIDGLRADTSRLADSIDGLATKEQVAKKADKSDVAELRRLAKRANINSSIAVASLVLVAVVGFAGWRSNADATDRIEAERTEARTAACNAYNRDTVDKVNAILSGFADQSRDPVKAHALIDQFLLPHRDCSPAGLNAYFSPSTTTTKPGG